MKKIFTLLLVLLSVGGVIQAQGAGLNQQQMAQVANSVVMIAPFVNGRFTGTGSGTIIDPSGIILTNRHVVEGVQDAMIMMLDDMREVPTPRYIASVIYVSDEIDLAVLSIDRDINGDDVDFNALNLPYLPIDTGQEATHGEHIYVFGYPELGSGYMVVTQGSITTIENGTLEGARLPMFYQTDAQISPGNSGGLAVNDALQFVGIPMSVLAETQTLGRLGGILPFPAIDTVIRTHLASGNGGTSVESSPPLQQQQVQFPTPVPNNGGGGKGGSQGNGQNNQDIPQFQQDNSNLTGGERIVCDGVTLTNNAVEVIMNQMRAYNEYRITAVGLNGFDPVLAVRVTGTNDGICADDTNEAAAYTADLPSMAGPQAAQRGNASLLFTQNTGQQLADISFLVGGYNNQAGEFLLILEGMAVTSADNAGDPFSVQMTAGMIGYGTPLTVYMISTNNTLDPYMYITDSRGNPIQDADNFDLACDDAGADTCWGISDNLSDSYVSYENGLMPGGDYDAMLQVPVDIFTPSTPNDPFYITFMMSSYQHDTNGDYIAVFHAGTQ